MEYLRVKNWRQFQHYRDRNPPWIKLHFALLSSPDWVTLNDASRVLAIASMLIASRNDGLVPTDSAYLRRVAYLNSKPNFKPLIDCGFLESASNCLQLKAQADAIPETETETEERHTSGPSQKFQDDDPPKVNGHSISLLLNDGSEYPVSDSTVAELEKLYPAVDTQQTLNEIRGWSIANPSRRKTQAGIMRHVHAWFSREQNKP
jgi:hypothetical protein